VIVWVIEGVGVGVINPTNTSQLGGWVLEGVIVGVVVGVGLGASICKLQVLLNPEKLITNVP
jgi:hypothetical protein